MTLSDSISLIAKQLSEIQSKEGIGWIAFLPAIVTIILFIFGYLINHQREIAKSLDVLEDWEEFFYSVSKSLIVNGKLQQTKINELVTQLASIYKKDTEFTTPATFTPETFELIPVNDLYKIFVNGKEGKMVDKQNLFRECYDCFLKIKTIKSEVEKQYLLYADSSSKSWDSWQDSLRELDSYKNEQISLAALSETGIDKYLGEIIAIMVKWQSEGNTLMDFTGDTMLDPLRAWCQRNINNPRSIPLLSLVNRCDYEKDIYESIQRHYHMVFLDYGRQLDSTLVLFESTVENLMRLPNVQRNKLIELFMTKKGTAIERLADKTDFM